MENPFEEIISRLSTIEGYLLDLKNANKSLPPQINSDKWLSIDELCEYLPGKPAKATIYIKCSKRQIPHKKNGSRLYFRKSEIDAWLNSKHRKTIGEITGEERFRFKNINTREEVREWCYDCRLSIRASNVLKVNFKFMDEINKRDFLKCRNAGIKSWEEFEKYRKWDLENNYR